MKLHSIQYLTKRFLDLSPWTDECVSAQRLSTFIRIVRYFLSSLSGCQSEICVISSSLFEEKVDTDMYRIRRAYSSTDAGLNCAVTCSV